MLNIFFYSKFYYFCTMNNPLQQLGNIPVTSSILVSLYSNIKGKSQKIRQLERDKQVRIDRQPHVSSIVCLNGVSVAILRFNTRSRIHKAIHDP